LLAVFASTTVTLVDLGLKTSVSGSLELLSFYGAFLLFLTLYCCRITSNLLINKLHVKRYLPPFTKQVTKTF
jgi:hypothetical protein